MLINLASVLGIVVLGLITYLTKKLTFPAACYGVLIATLIYFGSGFPGIFILLVYFILAVLSTGWKKSRKPPTDQHGKRDAAQVFANGGVAGILALSMILFPQYAPVFYLMMVSSIASATADTLSSELGIIYGQRFFNILTFKKDLKGLDGVISLEGTLIGLGAALLISLTDAYFNQWDISSVIIISAGMIGNLADSILGAAFERNNKLTNNSVNFLSTLIAAASALFIFFSI